jgi:hypothetical protein
VRQSKSVFEDMRRLLERIRDDKDMCASMGTDLA